jgi:hypothetical protein
MKLHVSEPARRCGDAEGRSPLMFLLPRLPTPIMELVAIVIKGAEA